MSEAYTIGNLVGDQVRRRIARLDPVHAAASFGALLTVPELQSNCNTIEAMVQLALAYGEGREKTSAGLTRQVFAQLSGGSLGLMEDPAEDVMVGTVHGPWGNFRILEGIWEGSTFYLQRMMDVLAGMPEGRGYEALQHPVLALLALSELAIDRAGLIRWQLGDEIPATELPQKGADELIRRRRHLRFTPQDLQRLRITPKELAPFVINSSQRDELRSQHPNESALQRRPLVYDGTNFFLVLATTVSAAIRSFIIDDISRAGMVPAVTSGLCASYAEVLSNSNFIGRITYFPGFEKLPYGRFAEALREVDQGRYCHLIFCVEALDDFVETGLLGVSSSDDALGESIKERILRTHKSISSREGFKEGLSLVVVCGVGRGSYMAFDPGGLSDWKVEGCSAYDFATLDGLEDFGVRNFWRILEARDKARELGALLVNINGLINLIGWSRTLKGHVVPHGTLPDGFIVPAQTAQLMMATNSQRQIRHESAVAMDEMVQPFVDGSLLHVRRNVLSPFADDKAAPLYGSVDAEAGTIFSLYVAPNRPWWAELVVPDDTPKEAAYERWKVVAVWLSRAAPVLDSLSVGDRPILWRCEFEDRHEDRQAIPELRSYDEIRDSIRVAVDSTQGLITTVVGRGFDEAQFNSENSAERALVGALVEGAAILAGEADPQLIERAMLPLIVTNSAARQGHAFAIREFRDTVHADLRRRVFEIEPEDDAFNRYNLGWSVRDRELGPLITDKAECISFLNSVVKRVEDDIINEVRRYNRLALIESLIWNEEAAAFERSRWERTSSALVGLHGRSAETFATIRDSMYRLNAVSQSSRNLAEIALCEADIDGSEIPGEMDIALLMAKAVLLFEIGGWSDAIRWDLMRPEIRITPLGDIHADFTWFEEIIFPHAQDSTDVRLEHEIENYSKHVTEPQEAQPIEGELEAEFNSAWLEQIGASIDQTLALMRAIENLASNEGQAILKLRRSELEALKADGADLSPETTSRIIDALTLRTRSSWREVPEGFDAKDIQPWRFRRRLSLVRRPLIQLDDTDDPLFIVAPGMLADGLAYSLINYHHGDFPQAQLSPLMKQWQARAAGERGTKFANEVAAALGNLGWEAKVEIKMTELFRRNLGRDYGDIDVLAWNSQLRRVAVIECKDLQYKKTIGELAEQLSDYRGEVSSNGRRDSLRKHLDRMELVDAAPEVIEAFTGVAPHAGSESVLMFSNPVPMEYALRGPEAKVRVTNIRKIEEF
jgi:hypothetical protein